MAFCFICFTKHLYIISIRSLVPVMSPESCSPVVCWGGGGGGEIQPNLDALVTIDIYLYTYLRLRSGLVLWISTSQRGQVLWASRCFTIHERQTEIIHQYNNDRWYRKGSVIWKSIATHHHRLMHVVNLYFVRLRETILLWSGWWCSVVDRSCSIQTVCYRFHWSVVAFRCCLLSPPLTHRNED